MRHTGMELSAAARVLAICLVSVSLASCNSDHDPVKTPEALSSPPAASARSEHASKPPTLLRVVNETAHVVVLTSADGRSTASVDPGKSLQLVSMRVCKWIPLTASTTNGRVLDKYAEPCRSQTWTITDLDRATRSDRSYTVAVAPEVSDRQASSVRRFIRFAAAPTSSSAAAVPFAPSAVTVTLDDDREVIRAADLADDARWFLSDGEGTGTTSALFVISNSITNARSGKPPEFVVTRRQMPLCDLATSDPRSPAPPRLFLALGTRGTSSACAPGFRITLDMLFDGTIQAVELAVRAP